MKCPNHPGTDILGFCHSCGDSLCRECLTDGIDYYFCKKDNCQKASMDELTLKTNERQVKLREYENRKENSFLKKSQRRFSLGLSTSINFIRRFIGLFHKTEWYYAVGESINGPVSTREIKLLIVLGEITPTTLVWNPKMVDWIIAAKVFRFKLPPPLPKETLIDENHSKNF